MNQLKDILDLNEKVLWEGKPAFIPFIASGLPFLGFGILWGFIDATFITQAFSSPAPDLFLIPFFLLHLFPLWGSIANMFRLLFSFKNTHYALTDKRAIMRTGFWGVDFKAIDYDKIEDLRVDVNPIENMFGVGSIKINTGLMAGRGGVVYDSISAIADPYKVFKLLKTTSVNIKTDWNYPNKLRPSDNPGYGTRYNPEKS